MRTTIVFLFFLASTVAADQWTKVAPPDQLGAWTIVADPHDPNVLYADGSGSRLWKTVDGGAHWSATTLTLPRFYGAKILAGGAVRGGKESQETG